MPAGRPSDYTPELATELCALIAEGKSLRTVCRLESMPSCVTVFRWMQAFPEFRKQYEASTSARADAFHEDIVEISDDGTNDFVAKTDGDGAVVGVAVNTEHIQRSRLRVDTRKWLMARMQPKKYGEGMQIEHSGTIGLTAAWANAVAQAATEDGAQTVPE